MMEESSSQGHLHEFAQPFQHSAPIGACNSGHSSARSSLDTLSISQRVRGQHALEVWRIVKGEGAVVYLSQSAASVYSGLLPGPK